MPPTFQEPRPTSVTVIGWAWIVLGTFMLLSATFSLIASLAAGIPLPTAPAPDAPEVPFAGLWKWFPVLVAGQVVVAVTGVIAGRRFLSLQARARTTLEILTWLMLIIVIGMAMVWVSNSVGASRLDPALTMFYLISGSMFLVYGAPLGLMLHHLRGKKIREAIAQASRPDPTGPTGPTAPTAPT